MTCIVGWSENNQVWIGGDSAGVSNNLMSIRADEKVFIKDDFIFGFTTSFRMGQLIRYKLNIPDRKNKQDIKDYLYVDFLDALIACFNDNGYIKIDNSVILGGTFIFGYKGKVYRVDSDFQICEQIFNFDAVGCGAEIALGCLRGLMDYNLCPEDKIFAALEASSVFSTGVRTPFLILKL